MTRWAWIGGILLLGACGGGTKSIGEPSDAGRSPDAHAGGSSGQGTTEAGAGGGGGAHNDAGLSLESVCGHTFDVTYGGKCQLPPIPAAELSRIRPRYVTMCVAERSRLGLSDVIDQAEACANALATAECGTDPEACATAPGTLPAGSPVSGRDQCQSFWAEPNAAPADGGLSLCGECSALIPVGQACGTSSAVCGATAICSRQSKTCIAVTFGDVGASCGTESAICQTGLTCSAEQKCAPRGDAGATCSTTAPCSPPLSCIYAADGTTGTCSRGGAAGATCSAALPCAVGLACSTAGTCAALTWAGAGQTCSEGAPCLNGALNYCPFDQNVTTGTCPKVVLPDGAPCKLSDPTTTCDTFAACLNGACTLSEPACK